MNDIDKILKVALSPTKRPTDELNNRALQKLKENANMRIFSKKWSMAAAILICLLVIPATAYAAYHYLSPNNATKQMGEQELANAFDKEGKIVDKTVTDGLYKITYLGHVTKKSFEERTGTDLDLHPDSIYIAVAVDKANGKKMSDSDYPNLFISPLIQGLEPWTYNIASMNGSYVEKVINGTLYRIIECDNIELFANKSLYLAVLDTSFYKVSAFNYDKKTGSITTNKDYKGTNILFNISLDSSKADPIKAADYLKKLQDEWKQGSDSDTNPQVNPGGSGTDEKLETQKELYVDKENKINIHIKPYYDNINYAQPWYSNDNTARAAYPFYFNVDGKNIESLQFTVDKGEFCTSSTSWLEGLSIEHCSKELSVPYRNQKDNSQYAIYYNPNNEVYGYDTDYLKELAQKDRNKYKKILYDMLLKEITSTNISLKILMKDGSIINKSITLKNVISDDDYLGLNIIMYVD